MSRWKQMSVSVVVAVLAGVPTGAPAQPAPGADFYEQKCGRCHVAYDPTDYPAAEWPGIVSSMRAQAGLTTRDMEALAEYLATESGGDQQRAESSGPSVGGYLYTEYFRTPEKARNFDIHYLAVYLSGSVNDKISYVGEFELEHGGTGGDNTFVEQAYIDWWLAPNVAVKIGAILTPFNRFDEFHDPLMNYTITRPQVSREIGVSAWKDVGVDVHGYVNLNQQTSLGFDAYAINGLGAGPNLRGSRQYRDNNEELALGGRLNLVYRDVLEVGGSAYRGAWDADGKHDLTMFGGYAMLQTDVADFYGEWEKATSENPAPAGKGEMSGYFVQASRLIEKRYRPTLRYGSLDYLDTGDLLGRDSGRGDRDVKELVVALSYYPTTRAALKIEYAFLGEGDRLPEKDNDQLGLQAAVKF